VLQFYASVGGEVATVESSIVELYNDRLSIVVVVVGWREREMHDLETIDKFAEACF
jgi:hypothetical protein